MHAHQHMHMYMCMYVYTEQATPSSSTVRARSLGAWCVVQGTGYRVQGTGYTYQARPQLVDGESQGTDAPQAESSEER